MDRNNAMEIIIVVVNASLSARRAWIEIEKAAKQKAFAKRSLSARRAWIEIPVQQPENTADEPSLSARRAWIEI